MLWKLEEGRSRKDFGVMFVDSPGEFNLFK